MSKKRKPNKKRKIKRPIKKNIPGKGFKFSVEYWDTRPRQKESGWNKLYKGLTLLLSKGSVTLILWLLGKMKGQE